MKKILFNIFLLLFLLLFGEAVLFCVANKFDNLTIQKLALRYRLKPIFINNNFRRLECPDNDSNNCYGYFRKFDIPQYKTKPILLLGCSFAHGEKHLSQNQIFSRKLSEQLKRPVYNRALGGAGLCEMLAQAEDGYLYEKVPPVDTVIYVFIHDQYRRMLSYKLGPDMYEFILSYKYDKKKNKLVPENYNNPVANFIKSTYLASYFNNYYVNKYIFNPDNAEKLTDSAVLYFVKIREALEKHFGKINFIVVLYGSNISYSYLLNKKLEQNGFKVVSTDEITQEDLFSDKYFFNYHPTEAAWDLLTPLIIEKAGLQ